MVPNINHLSLNHAGGNHVTENHINLYIISCRVWPHCVANILQEFVRDVSTKLKDYLNNTLVQQILLVETMLMEITLAGDYLYTISFRICPHCVANILQEFVRDVSTKLMDYLNKPLSSNKSHQEMLTLDPHSLK